MFVYNVSAKLNFPVYHFYCLLEMETKKSAIYSKCQTHPKLLLMIQKPFLILPIGTFKHVRRRPSNTSYFLPSKCMGFPNWWWCLHIIFDSLVTITNTKQLSLMFCFVPTLGRMVYVVFENITNNKCKTLSLLLILQVRLTFVRHLRLFLFLIPILPYLAPRKSAKMHVGPNL